MNEQREPRDIGAKCYCGGSTKYHYDKKLLKCDKTGEWVVFHTGNPCIKRKKNKVN